jgi:hypothetical protein
MGYFDLNCTNRILTTQTKHQFITIYKYGIKSTPRVLIQHSLKFAEIKQQFSEISERLNHGHPYDIPFPLNRQS